MAGSNDPWAAGEDAWAEAMADGPRRPPSRRQIVVALAIVVSVMVALTGVLWDAARRATPPAAVAPGSALAFPPTARAAVPTIASAASPGPIASASIGPIVAPGGLTADPAWVSSIAVRTGIPARALAAYVDAQLTTTLTAPNCRIGWTMLAGIGGVESNHGRFGGAALQPDGTTTKPILGPALDGTHGNKAMPATSAGVRLDGDPKWDHAVGPMQFLPSTWTRWGTSASGGVPNVNNIDDAALTAARYLCAAGGDLATPTGWRAAIRAYNAPDAYAQRVTDLADRYARASL